MAHSNAVQLAEHVGAALTADGATGIVTAYKFVGDGSSLTGIDATSIKDSGGTVRAQAYTAGVTVTGVLTATSLEGDGSALSNLPAGLGTAISGSGDGSLFYYTDSVLTVGSNLTLDSPTSAPVIYTQYPEVAVSSGVDLTIADGDELVTDALGISTAGVPALSGSGGRIRADNYTSYDATDAPNFPQGANITGIVTAGSVVLPDGAADTNRIAIGNDNDLSLYHNGANSFVVDRGTGPLYIRGNNAVRIESYVDDSNGEAMIVANTDGAVELYYDATLQTKTTSTGLHFADDKRIDFGTGSDLRIYHNGTHSYISDTGTGSLIVLADDFYVQDTSTNSMIQAIEGAQVQLHYNGTKKLETTAAGVSIAGTVSDSDGSLRSLPVNSQTSAYSLVAADAGKLIKITTGGVTCPNGESFAAGDMISIMNESGSAQTITQGGGATLYWTADGSTGNRTLGARGVATIVMAGTSAFYISGSGLS